MNHDRGNKLALVTGAAGLLGVQHCIALAEVAGTIIVSDRDLAAAESAVTKLKKEHKATFIPHAMDVTNKQLIQDSLNYLMDEYGRVDILVNNAAIDPKVKSSGAGPELTRFEHFSEDSWELELSVGLKGAFLCSQVFGSHMAEHGGGVILNIASDLSVIAPDQRLYRKDGLPEDKQPVKPVTYSVIKAGLVGLTKYLASYWADKNVRVNALSPGGVFNDQPKEFVEKLERLIPMQRMASRDEYRGAVKFLCSDESSYMTGQNLVIDGGRSII